MPGRGRVKPPPTHITDRLATLVKLDAKISVAPMMDWTDRHDRFFLRLISARARLYTEMVTTGTVIHGDREHLLGCDVVQMAKTTLDAFFWGRELEKLWRLRFFKSALVVVS